jgi:DNA-binding FadR family transcriptional regulator
MSAATRNRLSSELAAVLEQEIRERRYETGHKLPTESELATRFSASRSAVREAIAELRSNGMIHTRQGAGSHVASSLNWQNNKPSQSPDKSDSLTQVFEVRQELEPGAAAAAAARRDSDAMAALRGAFRSLTAASKGGHSAGEADIRFHEAIAAASGNGVFVDLIGYFRKPMSQSIVLARTNSARQGIRWRGDAFQEHRAILHCIEAGDSDAARSAMHLHIANARRRLGLAPIRSYKGRLRHQSSDQ